MDAIVIKTTAEEGTDLLCWDGMLYYPTAICKLLLNINVWDF